MAKYEGETPDTRFTVEGWVNDQGDRFYDPPGINQHPHGLLIHATDKDDPELTRWLWVYDPFNFNMHDLEEIEDYVDMALDQYESYPA